MLKWTLLFSNCLFIVNNKIRIKEKVNLTKGWVGSGGAEYYGAFHLLWKWVTMFNCAIAFWGLAWCCRRLGQHIVCLGLGPAVFGVVMGAIGLCGVVLCFRDGWAQCPSALLLYCWAGGGQCGWVFGHLGGWMGGCLGVWVGGGVGLGVWVGSMGLWGGGWPCGYVPLDCMGLVVLATRIYHVYK